jgi:7-carboxy-7-deazaguanine synthase
MGGIQVAEQFHSVQGEGPYAGTPAVFLRLAGCNLVCGDPEDPYERPQEDLQPTGDATWVCDTIEVWREAEQTLTVEEAVDSWDTLGFLDAFDQGAHLVLTGGEPTLEGHQETVAPLLRTLGGSLPEPDVVEVETNGTIVPSTLAPHVDQFNVSLKLANSGMAEDRRLNEDAIAWYLDEQARSTFKFVVSSAQDCDEVAHLCAEYGIPDEMVMLMPAGATQETLAETYPLVAEFVKERGWRFSPRLHIDIWDQMTGV